MAQSVRSMGVDVSKAELVAVIWPERERRAVANTPEGWQALSAWARALAVRRIGLEASGGYERGAAQAWADDGHWVAILNPERVRDFIRPRLKRVFLEKALKDCVRVHVFGLNAKLRYAQ